MGTLHEKEKDVLFVKKIDVLIHIKYITDLVFCVCQIKSGEVGSLVYVLALKRLGRIYFGSEVSSINIGIRNTQNQYYVVGVGLYKVLHICL